MDVFRNELSSGDPVRAKGLPQDPLRLAQVYESSARRGVLLDRIAEYVPSADFVPGKVHQKIARIPWAAIVTTNYDDLLERSFTGARAVRRVITDEDLTQSRTPDDLLIIKLHGDLTDRASIVITEDDYRLYESKRPGLTVKTKQLLLEHPLIFVGFSLNDPNFGAIDGWIRDTVDKVRLPAVAIMHGPEIPSESHMWKNRGIELIRLPGGSPSEQLERLFDAIKGERERARPAANLGVSNVRMNDLRIRLHNALEGRRENDNWPAEAAEILAEAVNGAKDDPDGGADATRLVIGFCLGHLGQAGPLDLTPVFRAIMKSHARLFLLFALDAGQIELTPDGRTRIDLSAELRDNFPLSPDEQARVHLARASVHGGRGAFKNALDELEQARSVAESPDLQSRISEDRHDMLFLSGDPAQIEAELGSSVSNDDAFALCRRGSQALLLKDSKKAEGWYKLAFERAHTGDEQFVALWGLRVARARGTALDYSEDQATSAALSDIPEVDRPRSEAIFKLADAAGHAMLAGKRTSAIALLKDYLRESRRLGWPHSTALSISFPLELTAGEAASLLLSREPDGEESEIGEIQEGLAIAVQFGLAQTIGGLFKLNPLSRLASDQSAINWFRQFVGTTGGIPRASDTRHVVAIAGLPVLDDSKIVDEVDRLCAETSRFLSDRKTGSATWTETLSDRWTWVRQYNEHLPGAAVNKIIEVVEYAIPDSYVASFVGIGKLHWNLWRDGGVVSADAPGIDRIVTALSSAASAQESLRDPFWMREVVGLIRTLQDAHLLNSQNAGRLATVAAMLLEKEFAANDPRRDLVSLLAVVLALEPTARGLEGLPSRMLSSIVDRSGSQDDWIALATRITDRCSPSEIERLGNVAEHYAKRCLGALEPPESWFRQPATAAALLVAVERQRGVTKLSDEICRTILDLGKRDGCALHAFLGTPLLVSDDVLRQAEQQLIDKLEGVARGRERRAAVRAAEVWLLDYPGDLPMSDQLADSAIAALTSESTEVCRAGWLFVRHFFKKHPARAPTHRTRAIEIAYTRGLLEPAWEVRAAVPLALAAVARTLDEKGTVATKLEDMLQDPVALVRRTVHVALGELRAS
jgi:hypothetical protein